MRDPGEAVFRADEVTFRYEAGVRSGGFALRDVDLAVHPGAVYGVIGPNGSGKSTLLQLLLGALEPQRGQVLYRGRSPGSWGERALARRVGVVPQMEAVRFPLTVGELVGMGRYPHLGLWRFEGMGDRAMVEAALEKCRVGHLADRSVDGLSGGEHQRVRVARALAQDPDTLVLDEPTASLDVRHEMGIFELLAQLAQEEGMTVLLVTHNLNLAARYAHRLLLLDGGRAVAEGPPGSVLERERLEKVYGWPVTVFPHPGPGRDRGAPQVLPLSSPGGAATEAGGWDSGEEAPGGRGEGGVP